MLVHATNSVVGGEAPTLVLVLVLVPVERAHVGHVKLSPTRNPGISVLTQAL